MTSFVNIYKYSNKEWTMQGARCQVCGRTIVKLSILKTHKCPPVKVRKRVKEEIMPIHKTQKGYYWGSKGPFPTREKAEEVAKAAYAHGYKKQEEKKSK